MLNQTVLLWVGFGIFVLGMLALDLGVFNKKVHVIRLKEAISWCAVWIFLALFFNLGILFFRGTEPALKFLTGYVIEYSLSVDNIFVFLLIFRYFKTPALYQHKILFWGILGALVMRGIFIFMGVALIQKFHWMVIVFGIFLVFTGIKMIFHKDEEIHPEKNPVLKLLQKLMPVTKNYVEGRFFIKKENTWFATPLFIVLLVVETTDVVFAIDSVPAVLAISLDPLIVYTSNVFAILGLRSLFFALAGIIGLFHYLHHGISAILVFVGVKMILANFYEIPISISLGVITGILLISILCSLLKPKKDEGNV